MNEYLTKDEDNSFWSLTKFIIINSLPLFTFPRVFPYPQRVVLMAGPLLLSCGYQEASPRPGIIIQNKTREIVMLNVEFP